MKLVDDAKQAWRWFSVWALGVLAALPLVWAELPPETHALIPDAVRPWIITAVALAGIAGRLVRQGGPSE